LDEETSVPGLLRLIGGGANGPILMALGPRSLRTKRLTERVPTYAPRTVYRHTRRLTELGLIDRQEIAGVPSTVIHSLSPAGRDLFHLLDSYAKSSLRWVSAPGEGDGLWTLCGLQGEMWASGWVAALSQGGRSVTELTEATSGLTFHQVGRRIHQLLSWNLLHESTAAGHKKSYQLSDQARHGMALIAGLGRWRERHVVAGGDCGLHVGEMATVLRVSLPLVELPGHREMSIKLGIVGVKADDRERGSEALTAHVGPTGAMRCVGDRPSSEAWALGTVETWFAAILDGNRGRMRVGGDLAFVDTCLKQWHETLWAAPVESGAR
jgi:DNA-binding HxlR family transcriptional regulator